MENNTELIEKLTEFQNQLAPSIWIPMDAEPIYKEAILGAIDVQYEGEYGFASVVIFDRKGEILDTFTKKYEATILASGSEVDIAVQSSINLSNEKIYVRVISFPSWELFAKQTNEYQRKTLGNKPIFAIEAGIVNGWEKYIPIENFLGMKTFGASGPYKKLYEHFGLTNENLSKLIRNKLKKKS